MVATSPARGQLNRENYVFPVPIRASENFVSRHKFGCTRPASARQFNPSRLRVGCLRYFQYCIRQVQTINGCGKIETDNNGPIEIPAKEASVTGTTLRTTGPVLTESRQRTRPSSTQLGELINSGQARWRLAVYIMDAAAESGMNPASKHQIQPECGEKAG